MKYKKILLLYKKSSYKSYFLDRRSSSFSKQKTLSRREIARFKSIHDQHYSSLSEIEKVLKAEGVSYRRQVRGGKVNYSLYDLVITVGGDGTFLEGARNVSNQVILGVNSVPGFSVGKFCLATAKNFPRILERIQKNKADLKTLYRLRLKLGRKSLPVDAINDVLVCHKNPAAMTRYSISIGNTKEEHRGSGIWISTAAGSTGAIYSAGGKAMPIVSKKFQYRPRELYRSNKVKYKLTGSVLSAKKGVEIVSLMREGMIFVDGAHKKHAFPYGSKILVSLSPSPLKVYLD